MTGLAVVAGQARLPKIVLIETNVLSREADGALIEKFSHGAGAEALLLRPVRTAIAAYETQDHAGPDAARSRAEQDRLLSRPHSTFDNKVYLDRALQQMNDGDPTAPARANVVRMRQLIDELQRRGVRVFLIHIPFAPEIEGSRMVGRPARSSTKSSPIAASGCRSIRRGASCAGTTGCISTNDPP